MRRSKPAQDSSLRVDGGGLNLYTIHLTSLRRLAERKEAYFLQFVFSSWVQLLERWKGKGYSAQRNHSFLICGDY